MRGQRSLSDVRFGSNVSTLYSKTSMRRTNLQGEDAWDSSTATPDEVTCREARSSEVGTVCGPGQPARKMMSRYTSYEHTHIMPWLLRVLAQYRSSIV